MRSTQGGEITVYGLTETAWQVSSVGLHVEKPRHDYRLKHPQGRQDKKQHEQRQKKKNDKSKDPYAILGPGKRKNGREIVSKRKEKQRAVNLVKEND